MGTIQWMSRMALPVALAAAGQSQAANGWDEALQGDLSNDGLAPTLVTMGPGANGIEGTTGNAGQGIDRDYFSFYVLSGAELTAIMVKPATFVSGGVSFMGVQSGSQVTGDLLGWTHYGTDSIGTNILPYFLPSAATALPSGNYAVWVQETGGIVTYSFDFVITAVPEPAASWLLGMGIAALASTLQRRNARSAATPQKTAKPSQ